MEAQALSANLVAELTTTTQDLSNLHDVAHAFIEQTNDEMSALEVDNRIKVERISLSL